MSRSNLCLIGGVLCLSLFAFLYFGPDVQVPDLFAGVSERRELVVDLPEDSGKWSLGVVYSSEDFTSNPADRHLRASFAAEPRLRSLIAQVSSTSYTPSNPMWKERFAQKMGSALPQLWLLDHTGGVVYKASGSNIPSDPTVLADEIQASIESVQDCRPRPKPTPAPVQPVNPTPSIPDIRPVGPSVPVVKDDQPVHPLLLILGVVGGGLLGAYISYKRQDG